MTDIDKPVDPHRMRNNIFIIAGTVVVIATYLYLILAQPAAVGEGLSGGTPALITLAGYVIGALLIAVGAINRLPTTTVVLVPVAIAINITVGSDHRGAGPAAVPRLDRHDPRRRRGGTRGRCRHGWPVQRDLGPDAQPARPAVRDRRDRHRRARRVGGTYRRVPHATGPRRSRASSSASSRRSPRRRSRRSSSAARPAAARVRSSRRSRRSATRCSPRRRCRAC